MATPTPPTPPSPPAPPIGPAAEALIQLAGKFQAVLDVAHALKGMTSIDNAIAERKQALTKATAEHEAAQKTLAITQGSLTALHAEILKAETDHRKWCDDLAAKTKAEAKTAADATLKIAHDEAAKITGDAKAEVDRVLAAHVAQMQTATSRLAAANKEAGELEIKADAARKEHEALTRKIADLKRTASQIAA